MTRLLNRRQLIAGGLRAGVGFVLGQLLVEGLQTLEPIEPGVFRVAGQSIDVDRVVFDTIVDGRAMRARYSGIEYFRAFMP